MKRIKLGYRPSSLQRTASLVVSTPCIINYNHLKARPVGTMYYALCCLIKCPFMCSEFFPEFIFYVFCGDDVYKISRALISNRFILTLLVKLS